MAMIGLLLPDESAIRCKLLYGVSTWLLMIGMAAAEAVLTIRTWAICGSRWWFGVALGACYIGVWVGAVIAVAGFLNSMTFVLQNSLLPILQGCLITSAKSNLLIIDWSLLFAYDAVNMGLIAVPAYHSFKQGSSSFVRMVLRDGVIYYVYIFVVALANIVVVTSTTSDYAPLIVESQHPSPTQTIISSTVSPEKLVRSLSAKSLKDVRICLRWVPGHHVVAGNEAAAVNGSDPRTAIFRSFQHQLPATKSALRANHWRRLWEASQTIWKASPSHARISCNIPSKPAKYFSSLLLSLPHKLTSLLT
ncbi:hypothetical protein BDQ17DRAFT_1438937 [Cyathus striatus]|nr:hypothetical protein BDQ17DRAFT_1438937 [Cyathus striatus]